MGCDIHDYCEVYRDGVWTKTGAIFPDYEGRLSEHPYDGRNYSLFAFLAGVRNYNEIVPLSEPRGIPTDASQEYLAEVNNWGVDGHSPSYFTIKELQSADLDQRVVSGGVLDLDTYVNLKTNGTVPTSYSRAVSGPNCFTLSEEEADEYLLDKDKYLSKNLLSLYQAELDRWNQYNSGCPAALTAAANLEKVKNNTFNRDDLTFNVQAKWNMNLKDYIGRNFWDETVAQMANLADDPNHVRFVFFFDN